MMLTEKVKEQFFAIKVTLRLKHKVPQQSGCSPIIKKPMKLISSVTH